MGPSTFKVTIITQSIDILIYLLYLIGLLLQQLVLRVYIKLFISSYITLTFA
jgi:hypothetical protein